MNRLLWRAAGIVPGLQQQILARKYSPLNPSDVAKQVAAIQAGSECRSVEIQDVVITVPSDWQDRWTVRTLRGPDRQLVQQADCVLYPPPGFYMQWTLYDWAQDSPEKLARQVSDQAAQRGWTIRNLRIRTMGDLDVVDAVTVGTNGVTHRFINFYYKGHEYFCEIKADTPDLFSSGSPLFDACLSTIRFQ